MADEAAEVDLFGEQGGVNRDDENEEEYEEEEEDEEEDTYGDVVQRWQILLFNFQLQLIIFSSLYRMFALCFV